MINYLNGKVILKEKDYLILDVNGVGYKIFVSKESIEKVKKDSVISVFTFLYLKRETIDLYGCLNQDQYKLFQILEKMSGIGPKTAIALAGFESVGNIKKAIETNDPIFQARAKGVGKKRIQMLILELTGNTGKPLEKDEVSNSLVSLGFSKKQIQEVVPHVSGTTEQKIKQSLKLLGK